MVRSIEIPEPLFEADVSPRWDRESEEDTYACKVLVDGTFTVFERTYRVPLSDLRSEDDVRAEFLAEFATKFKSLMEGAA